MKKKHKLTLSEKRKGGLTLQKKLKKNKKLEDKRRKGLITYYSSEEHREKHSKILKKAYKDEKLREKISKKLKEYYASPARRKLLSERAKTAYKKNPGLKKRIDKTVTEWWRSHPNVRKEYSERAKKYFIKNPKLFEKFLEGGKNASKLSKKTKKGIIVRSEGEKKIADFLASRGIKFCYECKPLFLDGWICVPDFYIFKNKLHIEYYGGHPKSWKKKVIKNKLYKKYKINVLCLRPFELGNLKKYLLGKLK